MKKVQTFDEFINESKDSNKKLIEEIKNFVKSQRTNLNFDDDDDDNYILFVTRENGSVYDETPGAKDIKDAQDIAKKLKSKFKNIEVDIEYVDEWVHLEVIIK